MILADRYVLQRRLGAGLGTSVWQAQDRLLQRDVALKIVSEESGESSAPVDDLVREATTASSLGSPHLIHVFDVVRGSDGALVVLELAEGPTLRELLMRHGRLPARVVAAVGSQVATALYALHGVGVLHGDVKPANILVGRPSGMVKLGDFGSAIRAEGSESRGSMLRYVTPEHLEGGALDPSDDLYALGLVLWECVAGRPPFVGESRKASAATHPTHEPEPLDRVAPSAPEALVQAVTMAVRCRSQDHPADASQIAARLETLSGHRPWGVTADFLRRDDDTQTFDLPPVRQLSTDDEETALRMATVAYSQTLVTHPDATALAALAGGRREVVARARDLLGTISTRGDRHRRAEELLTLAERLASEGPVASPPDLVDAPDRLRALRATELMDSPTEEVFDRASRLAARLLGVPVSLVSIVAGDRQFFKSQTGLPEPWSSRRETPLSHSFCRYVVESEQPLSVEDARRHPLFADNSAIEDLSVVSYLGVPVRSGRGAVLGSFCVISDRPREWTKEELALLEEIAQIVHEVIRARESV